jgi:hypothetical protein
LNYSSSRLVLFRKLILILKKPFSFTLRIARAE